MAMPFVAIMLRLSVFFMLRSFMSVSNAGSGASATHSLGSPTCMKASSISSSASSSVFLTDARRADAAVEDARKGRDAGVDEPPLDEPSMEAETADHWSAYPTN